MSRTIEENKIEQVINLRDVYGREPTIDEKVEFLDMARNEIVDRTQQGRDINNRNFKPYNEEYADFKGVSEGDVDLTLFGKMLSSIETEINGDNVIIRMAEDQAPKAHGNITGSYGRPSGDSSKARDFFGLNPKDIDRLAKQVEVVRDTPNLLDILGSAPAPDIVTPTQALDIAAILSNIGLFGDEG